MWKYLLIALSVPACFGQTIDENHELLWEISGNGLKDKSYLFGSFHSNDKRVFQWSDSTFYALNKTKCVSLETDVFSMFDTWDTRRGDVVLKYDNAGNPYTSSEVSSETAYGNEDGMPQFLDGYLQQYCYNAGKEFFPLETVESQLNLFGDIEFGDFSQMRIEALLVSKEDIEEKYIEGDIYAMDELMKANLSVSKGLYKKVITDRNVLMVERLDSLLKDGNSIFCAVGAGHLAGQQGMINLLRSKGYHLRKVLATYSDDINLDRLEVKSKKDYVYVNDSLGFAAIFPGKPIVAEDEWNESDLKLIYRDMGQGNTYSIEVYPLTEDMGLEELAEIYIASPYESPAKKITLDNGGEGYEGISDSYPEGIYWTRVIMGQDYILVLKAYGGNKFMNSPRAKRFFDNLSFQL